MTFKEHYLSATTRHGKRDALVQMVSLYRRPMAAVLELISMSLVEEDYLLYSAGLESCHVLGLHGLAYDHVRRALSEGGSEDHVSASLTASSWLCGSYDDLFEICLAYTKHPNERLAFRAIEALRMAIQDNPGYRSQVIARCIDLTPYPSNRICRECLDVMRHADASRVVPEGFFDQFVSSDDWEIRYLAEQCKKKYGQG